jgi:hypothetical protein
MPDGAFLIVLWACLESPADQAGFVSDKEIAERTGLLISEVRDCLETLAADSFVSLVRVADGYKVYLEAKGRLDLSQRRHFEDATGPGARSGLSFKQAVALMHTGRVGELVGRAGKAAYFTVTFAVGVPVLLFLLWNSSHPSTSTAPEEPPPEIQLEARSPVDGADYEPGDSNSEAQEERDRFSRLRPLKQICKSLRRHSEYERGWEHVLVIESKPFARPYRGFYASTVYAKAPDDRGNPPICFAFLVREEPQASVLKSLLPVVDQRIQGAAEAYRKVRYYVPQSQAQDRLVVILGISESSHKASLGSAEDTPSKEIAFRIRRE